MGLGGRNFTSENSLIATGERGTSRVCACLFFPPMKLERGVLKWPGTYETRLESL